MSSRLRSPSPALVIAMIALFVSLGGTALAAGVVVPLAKRALVADNAKKLQGKTAKSVAALAKPSGHVTVKTAAWSLNADAQSDFTTICDAGKAIAGGYDNPIGSALALDTRPSSDGKSWKLYLLAGAAASFGTLYAVCIT